MLVRDEDEAVRFAKRLAQKWLRLLAPLVEPLAAWLARRARASGDGVILRATVDRRVRCCLGASWFPDGSCLPSLFSRVAASNDLATLVVEYSHAGIRYESVMKYPKGDGALVMSCASAPRGPGKSYPGSSSRTSTCDGEARPHVRLLERRRDEQERGEVGAHRRWSVTRGSSLRTRRALQMWLSATRTCTGSTRARQPARGRC